MTMKRRVLTTLGGVLLLLGFLRVPARAQEPATTNPEIERLKAQLAAQQEQIDQLRRTLEEQKKVLDQASQPKPPSLGQVASTTAIIPAGDVAPVLHPGLSAALNTPQSGSDEAASPLQLKIGTATITPLGFTDFTTVFPRRTWVVPSAPTSAVPPTTTCRRGWGS
jgi:hypothetical protein